MSATARSVNRSCADAAVSIDAAKIGPSVIPEASSQAECSHRLQRDAARHRDMLALALLVGLGPADMQQDALRRQVDVVDI
jgi:hypothetical protein